MRRKRREREKGVASARRRGIREMEEREHE